MNLRILDTLRSNDVLVSSQLSARGSILTLWGSVLTLWGSVLALLSSSISALALSENHWGWSVSRMFLAVLAKAVLKHVGDWTGTSSVSIRNILHDVKRDEDLADLGLSVVEEWDPVLEVASAEGLGQVHLRSSNVVVLADHIVVQAVDDEELLTMNRHVDGVFPVALLSLACSDLSLLGIASNMADAVRIHLADEVVVLVVLSLADMDDQSSGESGGHWVACWQDNWLRNRRDVGVDLGWLGWWLLSASGWLSTLLGRWYWLALRQRLGWHLLALRILLNLRSGS